MANKRDKVEAVTDFIFLGSKITAESDWSHEIKRHLLFGRKAITNLGSELKSRDLILVTEVQIYGFSRSHILMWELDHRETWVPKDWGFQTVVLEKTLECLLDCKEIKAINLKGNQPWIFIGRTDAEAEAPILWPPDVRSRHIGKDLDPGKDWGQEEKGVTKNEMVR